MCAALAPIPRGTLHVMLTKPGEAGLALSKAAEAEREAAAAAVAAFQEAATGESLVSADPRATAAAVNAQLRSEQADLLDAGACHPRRAPLQIPTMSPPLSGGFDSTHHEFIASMSREQRANNAWDPLSMVLRLLHTLGGIRTRET